MWRSCSVSRLIASQESGKPSLARSSAILPSVESRGRMAGGRTLSAQDWQEATSGTISIHLRPSATLRALRFKRTTAQKPCRGEPCVRPSYH